MYLATDQEEDVETMAILGEPPGKETAMLGASSLHGLPNRHQTVGTSGGRELASLLNQTAFFVFHQSS